MSSYNEHIIHLAQYHDTKNLTDLNMRTIYACNGAVSANVKKMTHDIAKVTCKNCLEIISKDTELYKIKGPVID